MSLAWSSAETRSKSHQTMVNGWLSMKLNLEDGGYQVGQLTLERALTLLHLENAKRKLE